MVSRIGFFVSVISYFIFLALEWLRPGFVSFVFSPHLFLAGGIVFGVVWGWGQVENRESAHQPPYQMKEYVVCLLLGLILGWVVWTEGRGFEEFRVLVTLVTLLTPSTLYHLLSTS